MSGSAPAPASAPEVVVPIKVPQPEDHAPPSLAEPASGPVAEMSGALPQDATKPVEDKPTESFATDEERAPSASQPAASKPENPTTSESQSVDAAEAPKVPAADHDTDMKDTEAAPAAPVDASEPNGTLAAKGKRKSLADVPEHRSKTLKKKQSKPKITNLDAKPGDYFLARLRSYPPWPSIVCDEAMLPDVLLSTRPVTAIQADGSYKEPYADDGKKVMDRTYPVMFLHTNEFGWIPNTDLTPVESEQCKDVSEKGKSKSLIEAYKVAAEGHDLQYFKEMLIQHEAALQEDEARKAQRDQDKADKKKRKSDVKADEDVEMEDADAAPKKSSKKRKKEADEDDEEPAKPAKTPKTTKLKLTTSKTPTTEKKTDKKTPKPKADKKKKAQESEEEEPEPEKEDPAPLDPVQAQKDREKEVLFLRHKLQKGFLSRPQEPSEDEMPQMATYIKKLEAYHDKLDVKIIRNTKINKVLKGILKLPTIPKDEEYHFRERSVKLLGEWNKVLGAEPAEGEKPAKDEKAHSPATINGVHKDEEKSEEKVESSTEERLHEPEQNNLTTDDTISKISAEAPVNKDTKAVEQSPEAPKDVEPTVPTPTAAPGSEKSAPSVEDKAPESASAAAEAADFVKTTE